jgi:hypothetical protein
LDKSVGICETKWRLEMGPINFDLEGLRSLGYAVIDIQSNNYDAQEDVYKFMVVAADKNVYAKKIKELIGEDLSEENATVIMEEIYKHKWIESEKDGHDIGMVNAAKDWHAKYFQDWKNARSV